MRRLSAVWGFVGLMAIIVEALVRLSPHALRPFYSGMQPYEWGAYALAICLMGYIEGFLGFQSAFTPRAIARVQLLWREDPRLPARCYWLAPLFCMGLVFASRRRRWVNWSLVVMIVCMSVGFRYLAEPYRSIVDAGVVAGLTWGSVVTLWGGLALLRGEPARGRPELPEG